MIVAVLATALVGCGYQLKGQFRPPEGLSPIVWQSDVDAEDLYVSLQATFALYGIVLRTEPADTLLHIHRVETSEIEFREATVLTLEVEWSLANAYGVTLHDYNVSHAETRLALSPGMDEDEARAERYAYLRNRIAIGMLDQFEAITQEELNRQPEAQ